MEFAQQDPLITILILAVELIAAVMSVMVMWTIYERAGQPGWASLVPIYNMIVLMNVAGRPAWWFLLMGIPIVNLVIWFMICMDLAVAFDRGIPFAAGLFLVPFVFFPLMAFGEPDYVGPARR
jgi:Family of unknown function (DUF5684)